MLKLNRCWALIGAAKLNFGFNAQIQTDLDRAGIYAGLRGGGKKVSKQEREGGGEGARALSLDCAEEERESGPYRWGKERERDLAILAQGPRGIRQDLL